MCFGVSGALVCKEIWCTVEKEEENNADVMLLDRPSDDHMCSPHVSVHALVCLHY